MFQTTISIFKEKIRSAKDLFHITIKANNSTHMIIPNSSSRLQLSKFPLYQLNPENLKESLAHSATWVLPQVTALLARILVPKKVGDYYSFRETLRDLAVRQHDLTFDDGSSITTDHLKGIFSIVKASPRGNILGSMKQVGDGIRYAANVPLALAALKQYRNINYSEWDWSEPERSRLLDDSFFEYSTTFNNTTNFSSADLIQFRVNSTVVKSGSKAGTHRTIGGTTTILKSGVPEFDALPKLTKLALCQTWIFQPQVYHNLMIVNTNDLDSPADPLVQNSVLVDKVVPPVRVSKDEWDWLMS